MRGHTFGVAARFLVLTIEFYPGHPGVVKVGHDATLQELYAIALRLQAAPPVDGEGEGDGAEVPGGVGEAAVRYAIPSVSQALSGICIDGFGRTDARRAAWRRSI